MPKTSSDYRVTLPNGDTIAKTSSREFAYAQVVARYNAETGACDIFDGKCAAYWSSNRSNAERKIAGTKPGYRFLVLPAERT